MWAQCKHQGILPSKIRKYMSSQKNTLLHVRTLAHKAENITKYKLYLKLWSCRLKILERKSIYCGTDFSSLLFPTRANTNGKQGNVKNKGQEEVWACCWVQHNNKVESMILTGPGSFLIQDIHGSKYFSVHPRAPHLSPHLQTLWCRNCNFLLRNQGKILYSL